MRRLKELKAAEAKAAGGKVNGLWRLNRLKLTIPPTWVVPPTWDVKYFSPFMLGYNVHNHLYAVRSSSSAEDGKSASYAGQHETLLNVPLSDIPAAIQHVQQSGGQSSDYSDAMHQSDQTNGLSVIVQRMVPADYSGVLFTADPETKDRNTMVLEYVQGLGDRLVGGEVNPDGSLKISPGQDLSDLPPLVFNAVQRFHSDVNTIERRFRCPVDIEWAVSGGALYYLQARPITGVKWSMTAAGMGVADGIVEGRVRRLTATAKPTDLAAGEILVTQMTNPRMVGAMIRAGAIVTEIGGKLCHAAIVARELKKPCVVGCRLAGKLKTGDIVRVNATEGTVEIVK